MRRDRAGTWIHLDPKASDDDRLQAWHELNRRKLLALAGGSLASVVTSPVIAQKRPHGPVQSPRQGRSAAKPAEMATPDRLFFSAHEFATLEEIAEMIVPADTVSGGAKAARVPEFIDERLSESLDTDFRQSWRNDLAEIDRVSRLAFAKTFRNGTFAERARLLDWISRNESNPKEPAEYAFGTIKWQVTFAYYKTRIGVHDDLGYLGNVLLDEFLGTDVSKN